MKRMALWLVILVVTVAGCTPAATTPTAQQGSTTPAVEAERGGTLQVCLPQKSSYANLAGFKQYAGGEHFYLGRTVFSGLVQFNQEVSGFDPELAESWEFDGNNVIFHLRQDVTWHDGEPFTADDVLFTYGRLIPHPQLVNTGYEGLADYIVGYPEFHSGEADTVTGITAPDDYTIIFEMTGDYGNLALFRIAGWMNVIMPEHILGQVPEDQWAPDESGISGLEKTEFATTKAIGTGPFIVEEYVPDQYVVYSPNPDYFRGAPLLDQLIYRPFSEMTAMSVAIEAGQCDWAITVNPADAQRLASNPELNLELNAPPANVTVAYWYNLSREHLRDPRVRQAFQHAIDGERFKEVMTYGLTWPARSYLDGRFGINPAGAEYITYDPELAKQLLTEAGWDFENDKLILGLDSMTSTWEPMHLLLQENLAAVGVKVEFNIAGADYDNLINKEPYEWDLLQAGDWMPWFNVVGYEDYFGETPYYDYADYEEVRNLVESTYTMTDDEQIKDVVWQLQEMLGANPYALLLYGHVNISLRSTKTRGCDVIPSYYFQRNNWSLETCWMAQ